MSIKKDTFSSSSLLGVRLKKVLENKPFEITGPRRKGTVLHSTHPFAAEKFEKEREREVRKEKEVGLLIASTSPPLFHLPSGVPTANGNIVPFTLTVRPWECRIELEVRDYFSSTPKFIL